jgi:hypothetical protein
MATQFAEGAMPKTLKDLLLSPFGREEKRSIEAFTASTPRSRQVAPSSEIIVGGRYSKGHILSVIDEKNMIRTGVGCYFIYVLINN